MKGVVMTLLAVAAYSGLHSLLATTAMKSLLENLLGKRMRRIYRLFYNLIAGITFLPVLAIVVKYPGRVLYQIPMPWLALFIAGQVFGAVAILVGLLQTNALHFLGLRQIFLDDDLAPTELVVTGLYRWVRHPLYTAGLILIWFMPYMTTSLLALNIGLSFYLYVGSFFEERRLLEEYGEAYREYQAQVPRLFPRIG